MQVIQELLAGESLPGAAGQQAEQPELVRREPDQFWRPSSDGDDEDEPAGDLSVELKGAQIKCGRELWIIHPPSWIDGAAMGRMPV